MSTRTKIVLALVGLVVIWFLYDAYQKRKAEEEAKAKEPGCTKLSVVEWTTMKRQMKENIYQKVMNQVWQNLDEAIDFYNAYKIPAMEDGVDGSNIELVIHWGAWEEATKKMLEEGFCEQYT